jgi:hypothetical protein
MPTKILLSTLLLLGLIGWQTATPTDGKPAPFSTSPLPVVKKAS